MYKFNNFNMYFNYIGTNKVNLYIPNLYNIIYCIHSHILNC